MVVFRLAMLLPLGVSFMYGDAARQPLRAVLITFVSGATLLAAHALQPGRAADPRRFLLVALVWTVLPAFATLPF